MQITDLDKKIISRLQGDLPLQPNPYAAVAEEVGITEEELLQKINAYLRSGILRRMGTILRHHKAGFNANAMCGWNVPAEKVEEVGPIMAQFKEASHVYHRPTYPDWPYNLFTMLHGKSKEDLEEVAAQISKETGITDYKLLYSTKEYKKTSMKYF
ncbi:siroheme decarboxylase subunit beta [Dethiobacter alkaliphilus]|uniref:siroheme decarboxylase subunit beta n=1 Tax=Dethiobacter alkaliphilus TaxID=427926 RepID=UPI0022272B3C|nr:Lrp/AsnC family transcriptional regulator [Dethiobacter alkaliphilus]MCW3491146.1 Lrp/AsnC family transcriptional regulator [Dethiobacter alkaliphilus]